VFTEDSYVIAEEPHDLAVIIDPRGLGEPGGTRDINGREGGAVKHKTMGAPPTERSIRVAGIASAI
jgi:hypothetical protein